MALLKPRVMSLVVFTGFAGMVVAPGELGPFRAAATVLCIAVGAGAAAAINMRYDRDLDALMQAALRRPLPAGRIAPLNEPEAKSVAEGKSGSVRVEHGDRLLTKEQTSEHNTKP